MSNERSLFDRLGGEGAVSAAVDIFYSKVMADPQLAPFFAGIPIDRLVKKQQAFMTMAFGGPNDYTGRDLRSAHAASVQRGLGDEHFDAVAGHLVASLRQLKVPENLINEVLTIVGGTRQDVLGR
ncbi:MAG: group 1 truncated hemoglobin [Myxococcota bacterium]|nr:group 1 truncated hemoglobin [Myxococcota bacterium]